MCAAPTRRSSRCDCWQSQCRETQSPASDFTRIRPMPSQMGQFFIALFRLAQFDAVHCGGKDGAGGGKELCWFRADGVLGSHPRYARMGTPRSVARLLVRLWLLISSTERLLMQLNSVRVA